MAKKPYKKTARKPKSVRGRRVRAHWQWQVDTPIGILFLKAILLILFPFFVFGLYLNATIDHNFARSRWDLGAEVYGRAMTLIPGKALSRLELVNELNSLGYRVTNGKPTDPGTYSLARDVLHVHRRAFSYWDNHYPAKAFSVFFNGNVVTDISAQSGAEKIDFMRIDPMYLGQFDNLEKEERLFVKYHDIPNFLKSALVNVEDREFYEHGGISIKAILRALFKNIEAGEVRQGGSTLTQQLVKNHFLSSKKSYWRKFTEAYMAVLMELKFTKKEILEAYINEVYFGQDGRRSIHGFAMASQHFFGKPLLECSYAEIALLVGMLKAPSKYNPLKYKFAAKKRRDQVLNLLVETKLLTVEEKADAVAEPVHVIATERRQRSTPAFFDLVKRQLHRDYSMTALREKGLKIYTTLDPVVQRRVETGMKKQVDRLAVSGQSSVELQGAAIVTEVSSGEILGFVGSKEKDKSGYNRALDASRPIGSLIKPLIYLAALEQPKKYNLVSWLDDKTFSVTLNNGATWQPENFDKKEYGKVKLIDALSQSYNLSAAKLGMELGLPKLLRLFDTFALSKTVHAYPSLTLGAVELTPLQVAQIYNTIANNGYLTRPKVVTAVINSNAQLLKRYPIIAEPILTPHTTKLLSFALQQVTTRGTAKSLSTIHKRNGVAGKTGTSDNLKDSWFAGYNGQHLGVVWLGNDSNQPIGLTGATGAMKVWDAIMMAIPGEPLELAEDDQVIFAWINKKSGQLMSEECRHGERLPFIRGHLPDPDPQCAPSFAQSR